MNVLDLFSGIGGFSLGLERAGMKTVAFCEIEEFPRKVLAKHWPDVPIYEDVRELSRDRLESDGVARIDVICGGFPCQDISVAGKGAGLAGERSGLWTEFARLIGEIRPRYAIVENVAALLGRGLGEVLGDLAEIGYDAEWHCIPASYVGAPHRRDRVWIVAYPQREGREGRETARDNGKDWKKPRLEQLAGCCGVSRRSWATEPAVGRVVDGLPSRVDRLKGLGNAVVPQIPELIGRAIMEAA